MSRLGSPATTGTPVGTGTLVLPVPAGAPMVVGIPVVTGTPIVAGIPVYSNYLIISPDPTIPNTYATVNGVQGFWIKFGDGRLRSAYDTHNPSCSGVMNQNQPDGVKYVVDRTGTKPLAPKDKVWFGKWLEYHFLNPNYAKSSTEWHLLALNPRGPKTLEDMRQFLLDLMKGFPLCAWDADGNPKAVIGGGVSGFTALFENYWWSFTGDGSFFQMLHF